MSSLELAYPALNFDLPWFSLGRIRPLHTSAVRLHERYKRCEISPVEVTRSQLDALPDLGEGINAFVLVDDAVALKMARASE